MSTVNVGGDSPPAHIEYNNDENSDDDADTFGLDWDEKPNLGGVAPDSVSVAISAITTHTSIPPFVSDSRATLPPLFEAPIVVDDNSGEKTSDVAGGSSTGRSSTRTRLLEDVMKVAESDKSSSSPSQQLHLGNMKLHGREDDMNLLAEKLVELKRGNSNDALPELIFISGVSGTGKSALVMKGVKDPAEEMGLTFVGGKFDLNNTSMPLSAFVYAMVSLTNSVIEWDQWHKIQYDINVAFGDGDRMILMRALPGCEGLFSQQREEIYDKRASQPSADKETIAYQQYETLSAMGNHAIARLHYSIRRLLRIICTHLQGVVLFIDDLQWSDAATIDLLQSISLDSDIPSLLMVGAYREDEVSDSHPLLALQIRERDQMDTVIKIGNLTLENTTSLVVEALDMEEDEAVKHLAFIIQKKTEGNAFFVLMFLTSLYDEKLLQYNEAISNWTWDDAVVEAKLATANVAAVLVSKLNRLGESHKSILKIAACLGGSFAKSTVATVITGFSERETDADWHETLMLLDQSVDEFEREGIWEKESEDVWHFSHDKIQLVAFELISIEKRDSCRGEIGGILLEKFDSEALEANLFEVVSLRNFAVAIITNNDERKELAKMNLRAGMKASENAAFDSADIYFKAGREVHGLDGWDIDHPTMLKLYSEGANACFISGDLGTMNKLIAEVLSRDIPIQDKFNAYEVKIRAVYAEAEFIEVINIAFDIRRQLGLHSPKNKPASPLIIIKEFIKINHALGNMTAEDIANLPNLTDDCIAMGQRMLNLSASASYTVQPTIYPLIVFQMVSASLKYGISDTSCNALSGLALLLCGFGKLQKGREMSRAVALILAKPGMDHTKSMCMMLREGTIHHWFAPVQDTLEPLLEAYQVGLRTGDVENAANNLLIRVFHLYYAGRPLGGLLNEIQTFIHAMKQMNQIQAKLLSLPYLLIVKKLAGSDIEESEMSLEGIQKLAEETGNITLRAQSFMGRLELHVFFQQWEDAANVLVEAGDLRPVLTGFFAMARFTYLEGLVSIQAAKTATSCLKKRRWKKRAAKAMKFIRAWVMKGNINLVHSLHLLEAELAALDGKKEKAEGSYKAAITVASGNGFLQDRALSHELASIYFGSKGDHYWRDYHMERCRECYSEWGATAKVEQLAARASG